jgi:hypothetical protein
VSRGVLNETEQALRNKNLLRNHSFILLQKEINSCRLGLEEIIDSYSKETSLVIGQIQLSIFYYQYICLFIQNEYKHANQLNPAEFYDFVVHGIETWLQKECSNDILYHFGVQQEKPKSGSNLVSSKVSHHIFKSLLPYLKLRNIY